MDHKFGSLSDPSKTDLKELTYQRFGAEQAMKALEEYPADRVLTVLQSLYFEYRMYEETSKTDDLRKMFETASSIIEELCLLFV